jgi:hypothetical protein
LGALTSGDLAIIVGRKHQRTGPCESKYSFTTIQTDTVASSFKLKESAPPLFVHGMLGASPFRSPFENLLAVFVQVST